MRIDQSLTCYLFDMNTSKLITFNIEKPQGYTDTYQANFQQQDVRGRSSPFQSYINSGPRSISFSVLLALDYRRDLDKQTEAVRKMCKPYRSGGASTVLPPHLRVKIGNALDIQAIPTNFSAEWEGGYKNGIYRLCTWSFSFIEVENKSTYNNKDNIANSKSKVPAGLDYEINLLAKEKLASKAAAAAPSGNNVETGSIVLVPENTVIYQTSIEASNSKAVNEVIKVDPGEYKVVNVKDNTACITNDGGTIVGWVETWIPSLVTV